MLIPVKTISITESESGAFIREELPILIPAGCKNWPAFQKWSPGFFQSQYGDVAVPMSNYRKDPYQRSLTKPDMAIGDYIASALAISSGRSSEFQDLYSAGWFFCKGHCELLKDVTVPKCFENNWADKVQKVIHFDTRSILFGHPNVESPLHTDSFFVSTWFAMIRGQKRMRLVPPEHTAHVHNGFDVFSDEKLAELSDRGVPVYEVVIQEGDVVWFPPGWWHHVKNDTFTISLTTNFVDAYHFLPFEQQVRSTLIKPLTNLGVVKREALAAIGGETSHSVKAVVDSRFLKNESVYVSHFSQELDFTRSVIQTLESRACAS